MIVGFSDLNPHYFESIVWVIGNHHYKFWLIGEINKCVCVCARWLNMWMLKHIYNNMLLFTQTCDFDNKVRFFFSNTWSNQMHKTIGHRFFTGSNHWFISRGHPPRGPEHSRVLSWITRLERKEWPVGIWKVQDRWLFIADSRQHIR